MDVTVFVAEDDAHIRQVVEEYMKDAGFGVITAEDGEKAAEFIALGGAGADLYILDIMLPGVSGLDLLKEIRRVSDAPVIMLTALTDELTQLHSFDRRADDYVTKPFSPKILVKRAEALLHRSGRLNKRLTLGDVTLDMDAFEAYEDGNRIALTLKEMEILRTLIVSRRVLSRQQLLDIVWGADYFGDERTVDAHIKNLRKKFSGEVIITVKGVGYRIKKEDER